METGEENDVEIEVLRCRFLEWTPESVCALAATRKPIPEVSTQGSLLAVAREGGGVELLYPTSSGSLIVRRRVPGRKNRVIRALVWAEVEDGIRLDNGFPTLLGCSLDGTVFKVDWQRLCLSSVHETHGGAAWCMSVRRTTSAGGVHMNMNDDGVVVAVGCEDGGIKLFGMPLRTSEGDDGRKEEIEFRRAYPSCGSRVLSVGWRTDGASLFAGCSDSTLRCLDAATGQCLFVCGLEGGVDFDTAIWALKVLKNGTVVTGDSSGKITFWDGQMGSHIQTLPTHESDIFSIELSRDERAVFASGADNKVAALMWTNSEKEVTFNADPLGIEQQQSLLPEPGRWVFSSSQRGHDRDIRALTLWRDNRASDGQDSLISGSVKLCLHRLCDDGTGGGFAAGRSGGGSLTAPFTQMLYPYCPAIYLAPDVRQLLFTVSSRAEAEIWSLPPKPQTRSDLLDRVAAVKGGSAERIDMKKGSMPSRGGRQLTSDRVGFPSKLATIRLSGNESISCGAFSRDGTKVALSTVLLTRVFLLEGSAPHISTKRIQARSKSANSAAHCLAFSSGIYLRDGSRLFTAGTDGILRIIKLQQLADRYSGDTNLRLDIDREIYLHKLDCSWPLSSLSISGDGNWLATACCDGSAVCVFSVDDMHNDVPSSDGQGSNDCLWWKIPPKPGMTSIRAEFHGVSSALVLLLEEGSFLIMDVENRCMVEWSADIGTATPKLSSPNRAPFLSLAFDPYRPSTMLLCNNTELCYVNLDSSVPKEVRIFPPKHLAISSKRKRSHSECHVKNQGKNDGGGGIKHHSTLPQKNFTVCVKYRPMLLADYVGPGELVVVEVPWLQAINRLGIKPLLRHVYAT